MSSILLDPQVIDASTLVPKATSSIYLPVAAEGQADAGGTATVGVLYVINRIDESTGLFGVNSKLHLIVKALLDLGAGPVVASASAKGTTPTLVQRQAVWQAMEADPGIRLRITGSEVQADQVGLAQSVANANLLYNKQVAVIGGATGQTKANQIALADAIVAAGTEAAQRTVVAAPGVYDAVGTLRGGSYLAAVYAAEIAKNADPSNDLDLWNLPLLTGIERDTNGLPLFKRQVVAGAAVDDYEDLLQGGVSPAQPSRVPGGVMTTHLRMAYKVNTSFDSLYTRIIVDQVFVDVKNYILDNGFMRSGNTQPTRDRVKSGVEALLNERRSWISAIQQVDGSLGYNVTVVPSADMRQITVGYEGVVVRGISTVKVAANLSIPV